MWISFAFWPSLAATVISAVIVYLVIKADIKKPGNTAAFVLFLGVFLWSFGELVERIAGPPPEDQIIAYIGASIICVGVFLTPAGVFHFAIDYPYRLKMGRKLRSYLLYTVYLISVIGILLVPFNVMLNNIVIAGVSPYNALGIEIWGIESGPVHKFFAAWTFISALILIFLLLVKLRGDLLDIVRKQIIITMIGFLITFFLIVFTSFIPIMLGEDMYPLNTLAFSIFGIFVIYTINKYRMFLISPSLEEVEEKEELPDEGVYYMPKQEAYKKFTLLAKSGNMCTAFIPEDPDKFREKMGLKATTVFQLSKELGKDRLNPEISDHRDMMAFIITSLLEQVYKPVILIDVSEDWIGERIRNKIIEKVKAIQKEYGGIFFIVK